MVGAGGGDPDGGRRDDRPVRGTFNGKDGGFVEGVERAYDAGSRNSRANDAGRTWVRGRGCRGFRRQAGLLAAQTGGRKQEEGCEEREAVKTAIRQSLSFQVFETEVG